MITGFGLAVVGAMAFTFALGWWLGWAEFVIVGVGCALALLLAVPFVVGGHQLTLTRRLDPERVEVGEPAESILAIANGSSRRSAARVINDRLGVQQMLIDVPALAGGATVETRRSLPTDRRGIVPVGPAVVAKGDPLGLLERDLGRTDVQQLMVHPRVVALAPLRAGFAKDLDGPTYDNSPAGDVAFHAVREYAPGDDIRHIHWLSTARTGNLMVRHYVDNRRPYLAVIVDADPDGLSPDGFERALEVAASQVVSASIDGRPVAVWVGEQEVLTSRRPATTNGALDRLCASAQAPGTGGPAAAVERARRVDPDISAVLVVTGPRPAEDLLPVATAAKRSGESIIVRFVDGDVEPTAVPRARVIDCRRLDDFVARWAGLVR
ncbi:MAG: DUF58 domain-containing protein [Actinomycetota bacterium]